MIRFSVSKMFKVGSFTCTWQVIWCVDFLSTLRKVYCSHANVEMINLLVESAVNMMQLEAENRALTEQIKKAKVNICMLVIIWFQFVAPLLNLPKATRF